MFELIENIELLIGNWDKVVLAVLFIAMSHAIPIAIECFERERVDGIVSNV
jgi:hypothetical protein